MTASCAPNPFDGMSRKEQNAAERDFDNVVEKIVANIIIRKSPRNLLREVYMAGLYHGTLAARDWKE